MAKRMSFLLSLFSKASLRPGARQEVVERHAEAVEL